MTAPKSHSLLPQALAPAFSGDAPLTHRAWLHLVTAARRQGISTPTVRVQVLKRGATFCGVVDEPIDINGAELFRVELEHLGREVCQARNVRVCGARCACREVCR